MILRPVKTRRPTEDDSFIGIRVGVLLMIGLALFGVLAFRLWFLQILTGDQYVASAQVNRERTVNVEAPRGVIYDRNGKVLVQNRAGLSVGLLPMDMKDPKKDPQGFQAEMLSLAGVLDMSVLDLQKVYDKAKKDPFVETVAKDDVSQSPVPNSNYSVVDYLKEHSLDFPGIRVDTSFLRSYPDKAFATHVLGFVGEATQSELDQTGTQLKSGDTVGKDGVEKTYDSLLRGSPGHKTVEVDNLGRPLKFLEDVTPTAGNNLYLTIDSELQKAAEQAIVDGIRRAHTDGFKNADGGAVVALDPRTGQVLAMASYPTYDPSLWVGGMSQQTFDELNAKAAHNPFVDRAIAGQYPAGSTFKPFVAGSALMAGVITPDTLFPANGKFTKAGTTWKDWNPAHLGDVNLAQALMQSIDVYFYNVGYLMYNQTGSLLKDGLSKFGFGESTGIDLPGELVGRVPDKDWKASFSANKTPEQKAWKPGDDINLAIGQGDLLLTPLQLAVGLSAIANYKPALGYGTVWVPHVGLQITDPSGNAIHQIEPESRGEVPLAADYMAQIQRGLRLVVSDPAGTAYKAFKGFPIAVAGKTGTAQKKPGDDYAWFMGYAPANNPEIVVVALIEQGGHGSSIAAPMVRQVMEAYFHTNSTAPGSIVPTE